MTNNNLPTLPELLELERQKNWVGAAAICEQYLTQSPDDYVWLDHMVMAYFNLENHAAALVGLDKMLAIKPNNLMSRFHRAATLKNLGQLDRAIEELEWLGSCDDYPKKHLCQLFTTLALNYHIVGNYAKAMQAVKIARTFFAIYGGDELDLKKREAFCHLHNGDYAKGFELYEFRHSNIDPKHFNPMPHHVPEKIWHGEDITNKTLLIAAEQGLGDMVMMARFLPLIKTKAKKVIVECYQELYRLFRHSPVGEGVEIVLLTNEKREFDVWTKMMSLPYHLNINDHDLPNHLPYLLPPATGFADFAPTDKKYKIGLVWQSGVKGLDKVTRSMGLQDIAPLLSTPDCQFFSFQYDKDPEKTKKEITEAGFGNIIFDTAPLIKDLSDTALLLSKMDLIITVDTVIAHLAGALNKPTWVILPFESSWKWHRDNKTVWYPRAMTLFRQTQAMQWKDPVAQVVTMLHNLIANHQGKEKLSTDNFSDIEKFLPTVDNTVRWDKVDLIEKCKVLMNEKKYWASAIYLQKMLRDKNTDNALKKIVLLNARNAWRATDRWDNALARNEELLAFKDSPPADMVDNHLAACQMLQNRWQMPQAMEHLLAAKKILDAYPALRNEKNLPWQKQAMFAYLRQGDFLTAWQHWQYRHEGIVNYAALKYLPHHKPEKKWQMGDNIKDKIVLVAMEQGYGDIMQFARFIPTLARQCRGVVVEAYEPLYPLFKATLEKDNITVVRWETETPQFDTWLLVATLGPLLAIDEKKLRQEYRQPYFHLPSGVKKNLDNKKKKIGINWYSSLIGKDHAARSTNLKNFFPLFEQPNCDIFSLQLGGAEQIKKLGLQAMVYDLSASVDNFLDTASWVAGLDMVITVDTAMVHLCGALGVKTKLLLPKDCDPRWGATGDSCLLYGDHVKLYRAKHAVNDWAGGVVEDVLRDI